MHLTQHGAVVLLLIFTPAIAAAECTATTFAPNRPRSGETIGIQAGLELPAAVVEEAVGLWRQCANYGLGFPAFVSGPGEARTVTVNYHPRSESAACGRFSGNRIDLFAFSGDAGGRIRHCGPRALVLAHELGHVLGLADVRGDRTCGRHIMSDINKRNRYDRVVQDDECQAASQRWLTGSERRLLTAGSFETAQ